MGRRGRNKAGHKQKTVNLTLREEATGKKEQKVTVEPKLDHLKNVASWAGTEACMVPVAAFFGERLAASGEANGVPAGPSLFSCQICESILRPGYNCIVRVAKNTSKICRRKKSSIPSQNHVIYKCNYCGDRNQIRGTPKGHMNGICPPKSKRPIKLDSAKGPDQEPKKLKYINSTNDHCSQMDIMAEPDRDRDDKKAKNCDSHIHVTALPDAEKIIPATPSVKPGMKLLDSIQRKRKRSGAKKTAESESISASVHTDQATNMSNKRKKKGWTSLKDIAERNEKNNGRNLDNLTIPFFI